MIVGLDFDNTIACYDGLFHRLAVERGLIDADHAADKTAIRDGLRAAGREDDWTEMQGLAYGPRIVEAEPFPGAVDCIAALHEAGGAGVVTYIVSHKTRTPYRGEPHDLHAACRAFLTRYGISPALIPATRVFLEPTKEAKIERIRALGCTHFVDDLPEFLAEPTFPAIEKLNFGRAGLADWAAVRGRLEV